MNPKPKILLACPISDKKDYIMREWLNYLTKLEGPVGHAERSRSIDILLIDNSKNKSYHRKIAKLTKAQVIWRNPRNDYIHKVLADCQNYIREYAIKNNYTHWFSLECDVFPPLDVIPILLAHQKDVVGFTYFMNFREKSELILHDVVDLGGEGFLRNRTQREGIAWMDGKLKTCYNIGIGCLMISREVFTKIPFRFFDNRQHGSFIGNDTVFAQELHLNNIPIYCDTSHICTHINSSW